MQNNNIYNRIKSLACFLIGLFLVSCAPKIGDLEKVKKQLLSRSQLFEQYNFEYLSSFRNNKAIAVLDGQSILIDQSGRKIMDYPYDDNQPRFFGEDLIVNNGTMGKVINMKGDNLIDTGYTNLKCICDCGYFKATKDGKSGILTYDDMNFYPNTDLPIIPNINSDGHLLIKDKKTNTTNMMAVNGTIIKNIPYKSVKQLDNGNYLAKNKGHAILLDSRCEKPISEHFSEADEAKNSVIVTQDHKRGIIDKNGVELLAPQYDRIYETQGHYIVIDSISMGLLDSAMNIVYQFDRTCTNIMFYSPYFICTKDSSSLAYNINSSLLEELPYQIIHQLSPVDRLTYKAGSQSGLLNSDLSVKSSKGINHPALGMEVIDDGKNKALLMPNGSYLNNTSYSSIKSLELNNRLVLGHSETKKVGLYSKDGLEILPMQYDHINYLNRNFLTVVKDRLTGIINQNGEIILEPQFERIEYKKGFYVVKKDYTKSFLLDEHFNPSGPKHNKYVNKILFLANLFIMGNDTTQVLYDTNTEGILVQGESIQQISPPYYIQIKKDELFGIMDVRNLEMVVPYQVNEYRRLYDDRGYSKEYFEIGDKLEINKGIADLNGNEILPVGYGFMKWFSSENETICIEKENKIGIVSFDKKVVVPFLYDRIGKLKDQQYVFSINEKHGVLDDKGKVLVPADYTGLGSLSEGKRVVEKEEKWGYLDQEGKVFISPKYEAAMSFKSNLAIIKLEGLYGVINEKEEIVIPIIYKKIEFRFKRGIVEKMIVTLEDQSFTLNLLGQCIEDCPNEELLSKYGLEIR